MIQRFQIEDLVVQDSTGVLFRALDNETNRPVALRRFFPFGADGGGLEGGEQTAYNEAVQRLADIQHPSLRSVISGGCDPVDGMPYIATEWIEGTRLQTFIDRGPLSHGDAVNVLSQALEACELLSQVLGREGIWIETDLRTIVVGAEGTDRGITFWISPLKWIGKNSGQHGLEAIATLAEAIAGPAVSGGLGGWLKWLRSSTRNATLHEAREMLAKSAGAEAPVPTRKLVQQATRPIVVAKRKKRSNAPFVIGGIVALAAIAGGGWALIQWNNKRNYIPPVVIAGDGTLPQVFTTDVPPPPPRAVAVAQPVTAASIPEAPAPAPTGETAAGRANRMAPELSTAPRNDSAEKDAKAAALESEISKRGRVFTPADQELLIAQRGEEVIMEGVVASIGHSQTGATMYLQFTKSPTNVEPRGAIVIKNAPEDLGEAQLESLIGRKVRLRGKVQIDNVGILKRPVVLIGSRAAIKTVE